MQSPLAVSLCLFLAAFLYPCAAFTGESNPVSIDWLVNYYAQPILPEEDEYFGKTIEVEGWITACGNLHGTNQYVELRRFSARVTHTRCYFSDPKVDVLELAKHSPELVHLRGVCRGYDELNDAVILEECEVVGFVPPGGDHR